MSAAWVAFWIGVGAPSALYVTKRLVDYLWPPGRHWPLFDRFSKPNDPPAESKGDD